MIIVALPRDCVSTFALIVIVYPILLNNMSIIVRDIFINKLQRQINYSTSLVRIVCMEHYFDSCRNNKY